MSSPAPAPLLLLAALLVSPRLCSECVPALAAVSPVQHTWAPPRLPVSRLAFSSCFKSELMGQVPEFWRDVRNVARPHVWLFTGDTIYSDGPDMNAKRVAYNQAREEESYRRWGPVSQEEGVIPVLATWDDHDYAYDNAGAEFPCAEQSRAEWAAHFNITPDSEQPGVYSSRVFSRPDTGQPGVHVIMLDGRSGRDPTVPDKFGACLGSATRMLAPAQWAWLEAELELEAEVTVIVSGIQVLPPTNLATRPLSSYCAHDSHNPAAEAGTNTFLEAGARLGEGAAWRSVPPRDWENWAEVPLQRERLLGLAQRTMNRGSSKMVVFVSGDVHWAEFHAKRMPASSQWGPSQVLYEVTASGVPQNWPGFWLNSNRLRDRTADTRGDGVYNRECRLPFTYHGVTYEECTEGGSRTPDNCTTAHLAAADSAAAPWCSTLTTPAGEHVPGQWGHCAPLSLELAQQTFTNSTKTCADSRYNICLAQANYGYINIDYEERTLEMGVRTPAEGEQMSHKIKY